MYLELFDNDHCLMRIELHSFFAASNKRNEYQQPALTKEISDFIIASIEHLSTLGDLRNFDKLIKKVMVSMKIFIGLKEFKLLLAANKTTMALLEHASKAAMTNT